MQRAARPIGSPQQRYAPSRGIVVDIGPTPLVINMTSAIFFDSTFAGAPGGFDLAYRSKLR